jgi:hypothetical protein
LFILAGREQPALSFVEVVVEKQASYRKEDHEVWLRASMPALRGPLAGKPWIKYVLREV